MSFKTFGFSREILAQIEAMQYTEPTPIQKQAIPVIMEGRDVMGLAQTGTGKTAAFALPILQHLITGRRGKIRALIVAPTRELAEQINDNIQSLGKGTGLKSLTVYGGVKINPQIRAIKKGVDILVACPGRLLDLINHQMVELAHLEIFVLDEADHMFDMGFLPDLRRIISHIPLQRQTLLFSATMPPDIQCLADKILNNPCHIKISIEVPLDTISHVMFPVAQHQKSALLLEILKSIANQSVLIFTRTKHMAKKLGILLANNGHSAVSLQGNLSQNRRQEALDGFREGIYQIMVATDIAARGIDVLQISHVINYDMPDTEDAYTHRTGRTGRATRKGKAFTLMAAEDKRIAASLEKNVGIEFAYHTIQGFSYDNAQKQETSGNKYPIRRTFSRGNSDRRNNSGRRSARVS